MNAQTTFKTANARRYLGTLCKHFGHKVPVRFDTESGEIDLPFGQCALEASDTELTLRISAEDQPTRDKTIQVITSHLERFAFRENPVLDWQMITRTRPF